MKLESLADILEIPEEDRHPDILGKKAEIAYDFVIRNGKGLVLLARKVLNQETTEKWRNEEAPIKALEYLTLLQLGILIGYLLKERERRLEE